MLIEGNLPSKLMSDGALNQTRISQIEELFHTFESRFLPTMVRSLYYALVSSPYLDTPTWNVYGKADGKPIRDGNRKTPLSDLVGDCVKYLRFKGRIPMDAIIDESRTVTRKKGYSDAVAFVESYLDQILPKYYDACRAKGQENYIEVWVEKNGLAHIAQIAADEFSRSTVGCHGDASITSLKSFAKRAMKAHSRGKKAIILYYGDLDPSGWRIVKSIQASIHNEERHNCPFVEIHRMGLNPEQITNNLTPYSLKEPKTDSIRKAFTAETGLDIGYELNAVPAATLVDWITADLEAFTDMGTRESKMLEGELITEKFGIVRDKIQPLFKEALLEEGLL